MLQSTKIITEYKTIFQEVAGLIESARRTAARTVNAIMTATYWEIGRRIIEFEQGGETRASYGKGLLKQLSNDLKAKFGRGFSRQNLQQMRQFYLAYPPGSICQTVSGKLHASNRNDTQITVGSLSLQDIASAFPLSWSHYVCLLPLKSKEAREFYEAEAFRGGWSLRQLNRQISSQFYERVLLSRNKAAVLKKGHKPLQEDAVTAEEEIKDPLVLEFLNLKDEYSEKDLEEALLRHLENFLLELGNDFTFVGRQRRLRIGDEWYRVDLLFFHRRLCCLIIVELKLTKFSHADAGQINMYLNYAKEHWTHPHENPPIGLILCAQKNEAVAHYALDGLANKVLATEYRMKLPDEKILVEELDRTRKLLEERIQIHKKKIHNNNTCITQEQIDILKAKVKQKGRPVTIWRKFNKVFGISRYIQLPQSRYQEALTWIDRYT